MKKTTYIALLVNENNNSIVKFSDFKSVEDFKNGKDRAIGYLVGQIMKQTRGKANPKMVNKLLNQELQSR